MLKQQAKLMTRAIMAFDALVVTYSFLFAYTFRESFSMAAGPMILFKDYLPLLAAILPLWVLCAYVVGTYTSQRMKNPVNELIQIAKVGILLFAMLSILTFLFKLTFVSRSLIILFVICSTVYTAIAHMILRIVLRYYRRRGRNFRTLAIAGAGEQAREMAEIIRAHSEWGLKFIGYITPGDAPPLPEHTPCLGHIGDLEAILKSNVIDEVIFVMSREKLDEVEEALILCEDHGISTKLMINIFPHRISRAEVEEIGGVSMLSFTNTPQNILALAFKRLLDIGGSLFALIVASPIMVAVAIAIKTTSNGPVLFGQKRTGRNGREFMLWKFRSMVTGAEKLRNDLETLNEMDGPVFKIKNDPRITVVGKFIRKTSIDEMPQFLNVLMGDMSIVGPRPLPTYEVAQFKHWHRRRLSVKPGITCYWQISGRNKLKDFEKDILPLDLKYIDNWSLTEDFKIILKTIPAVLLGRGAS